MNTNGIQRTTGGDATLKGFLESPQVRAKLAEVASSAMKPDDLIRMALMAASRQPELAKCSRSSIVRSLLDAAALGIKPGGLMGRGWLVPRWNKRTGELECAFDPGWRGLIDVARRSGEVRRVEAHVVYERDEFVIEHGLDTRLIHRPCLDGARGDIVAAYAVAWYRDGGRQLEVLLREDIDKIRRASASKSGPWVDWYDEMARKSAVRRLCKYLPYDPVLEDALEMATAAEQDDGPQPIDVDVAHEPKRGRAKALAEKIRAKSAPADEPPQPADELDEGPAPELDEYPGDDPDAGP
jgi:recombination protein RecT